MTLALTGKTPRRRTVLVLAAFFAIIGSTLGGLWAVTSASAHAANVSGTAVCGTAGTWTIHWKVDNDTGFGSATLSNISVNHGTAPVLSPLTLLDTTAGGYVPATGDQTAIPLATTSVNLSVKATWPKDGYEHTSNGTVDAPTDCYGKIQIHKYEDKPNLETPWQNIGAGASKPQFDFTLHTGSSAGPSTGSKAPFQQEDIVTDVPKAENIYLTESPAEGYTLYGFWMPDKDENGNSGNAHCVDPVQFGGTIQTTAPFIIEPADWLNKGDNKGVLHICAYNQNNPVVVKRTLYVDKVILGENPDNAAVFSGTVDSQVALTWQTTNNAAPVLVSDQLDPGTYPVHENDKPGYNLKGFSVVYAGQGAVCPPAPQSTGTEGVAELTEASENTVATVCVYNEKVVPLDVTFSKYICDNYGDVPANKPGGGNDIGKNDGPTGLTHADLGSSQGPSCVLATTPWTFNLSKSDGTLLQAVPVTGNAVITLNADVMSSIAKDGHVDVREVYQSGYGFGALTCTGDGWHDDNWEWLSIPAGTATPILSCTAYNVPATREITIDKHFVGLPDGFTLVPGRDYPTFTFTPSIDPAPSCTPSGTNPVTWTCTVPWDWKGTVTETPPSGWAEVQCPETKPDQLGTIEPTGNWTFCNAPYGTVSVNKVNTSTAGPEFTATISGGAFPGNDVYGDPLYTSVTIKQGVPAGQAGVPLNSAPINVVEKNAGTAETCGSGATSYFTIVQAPADKVLDTPGEVQTWTIVNQPCGELGQGGIVLEKYRDNNGDGTANGSDAHQAWTFQVTGPKGYDQTFALTAAQMPYLIGSLPPGDYTVKELTQSGWTVVGLRVDSGALMSSATQTTVAVDGEKNVLRNVTFFNQPLVTINVHKTEQNGLITSDGAGWKVTLSGCGMSPDTRTTDPLGNVSFENLPLCATYLVSEDLTSKAPLAYVVASGYQSSYAVNATTAGQTYTVLFVNALYLPPPPYTPETPTTPVITPTPETPTATATQPVVIITPTATPTEAEAVEGEKTPGQQATPIAPVTGSGSGGSGGMNIVLAGLGLAAVSLGLGTIALGRRRTR